MSNNVQREPIGNPPKVPGDIRMKLVDGVLSLLLMALILAATVLALLAVLQALSGQNGIAFGVGAALCGACAMGWSRSSLTSPHDPTDPSASPPLDRGTRFVNGFLAFLAIALLMTAALLLLLAAQKTFGEQSGMGLGLCAIVCAACALGLSKASLT